jgi:hypothetical protein
MMDWDTPLPAMQPIKPIWDEFRRLRALNAELIAALENANYMLALTLTQDERQEWRREIRALVTKAKNSQYKP